MVKIQIDKIILVPVGEIKLDKKNRNKHPQEQLDALCKQFLYQGMRQHLTVSNRTGTLKAGHCRLMAAKMLGMTHVPVSFQDFDDAQQEYLYGIADNAVQKQSMLDFAGINTDLPDFGPELDLELLAIPGFGVDASESYNSFDEPKEKGEPQDKESFFGKCPNCGVVIEKHG